MNGYFRDSEGKASDVHCKCGGCAALWNLPDAEYPFIRQGVMHSPVGCLRRELDLNQLKSLYFELTGLRLGYEIKEIVIVFQAVMNRLELDAEAKALVVKGTLPRRPSFTPEFAVNTQGSPPIGTPGKARVIPGPSNPNIKPPWLR